jgi:hypothetical protein
MHTHIHTYPHTYIHTQFGNEEEIKTCIAKYDKKRDLMDPDTTGYHTMANTHSMYHQPAQEWIVVG